MTQSGAVILGAGFARRFGSDKRLHPIGQSSVARTTLELYLQVFDQLRLVVRREDSALQQHVADLPVKVISTDQAELGMGHSLRAGMTDLNWPFAFVGLLDMPFVQATTLQHLAEAAAAADYQRIIRPRLAHDNPDNGPGWGHPIGFPAALFAQFSTLSGDQGARPLLTRYKTLVTEVRTDDQGIVRDIDHPDDLGLGAST
ncbi:MAG: nucleotidyltransferase family protein [Pseudomonadales bacterium]